MEQKVRKTSIDLRVEITEILKELQQGDLKSFRSTVSTIEFCIIFTDHLRNLRNKGWKIKVEKDGETMPFIYPPLFMD